MNNRLGNRSIRVLAVDPGTRGFGYATSIDEIDLAVFLNERGQGQQELVRILGALFEGPDAERVFGSVAA